MARLDIPRRFTYILRLLDELGQAENLPLGAKLDLGEVEKGIKTVQDKLEKGWYRL